MSELAKARLEAAVAAIVFGMAVSELIDGAQRLAVAREREQRRRRDEQLERLEREGAELEQEQRDKFREDIEAGVRAGSRAAE